MNFNPLWIKERKKVLQGQKHVELDFPSHFHFGQFQLHGHTIFSFLIHFVATFICLELTQWEARIQLVVRLVRGLIRREAMLVQVIRDFRVLNLTSFLLMLRSFLECLKRFQLLTLCSFFDCVKWFQLLKSNSLLVVRCCEKIAEGLRHSFLVISFKFFCKALFTVFTKVQCTNAVWVSRAGLAVFKGNSLNIL